MNNEQYSNASKPNSIPPHLINGHSPLHSSTSASMADSDREERDTTFASIQKTLDFIHPIICHTNITYPRSCHAATRYGTVPSLRRFWTPVDPNRSTS